MVFLGLGFTRTSPRVVLKGRHNYFYFTNTDRERLIPQPLLHGFNFKKERKKEKLVL